MFNPYMKNGGTVRIAQVLLFFFHLCDGGGEIHITAASCFIREKGNL